MNEKDKLREAVQAYQDARAAVTAAEAALKEASAAEMDAEGELARVIRATGGKPVVAGGWRFFLDLMDADGVPRLVAEMCEDRTLD